MDGYMNSATLILLALGFVALGGCASPVTTYKPAENQIVAWQLASAPSLVPSNELIGNVVQVITHHLRLRANS